MLFTRWRMVRASRLYAVAVAVLLILLLRSGSTFLPSLKKPSFGVQKPISTLRPGSAFSRLPPPPISPDEAYAKDPEHYPPYNGYKDKDYDPNRWHYFPRVEAYYNFTCCIEAPSSTTFLTISSATPYVPKLGGKWREESQHRHVPCVGPRRRRFNESSSDLVMARSILRGDFPAYRFGSFEALGLNDRVCFDRLSRYGAYGLEDDVRVGGSVTDSIEYEKVNWEEVRWGELQEQCLQDNNARFKVSSAANQPIQGRTAVLIRTWDSYEYTPDDITALRSLITELALYSGAEYQVVLFVHVKDKSIPIWTDKEVYRQTLELSVPTEFRDIAQLWNEEVCERLYPNIGENGVYFGQFQPLQWFASQHPEFSYFWNWEMDMRFIGHHYELLSALSGFAANQPRKYLWERSSIYYIPALHGSWSDFSQYIASVLPLESSVWGPIPADETDLSSAVYPLTSAAKDKYKAGVDEEADLITSLPFFNPQNTFWTYRDKIWNFSQGPNTPRRVFINTFARFSRRLLDAMHLENKEGRGMASEMWPATVCLHYGLKAVYAPHPIWTNRDWPVDYANEVFNFGPEPAPGTGPDAAYNPDREHNFAGFSWYFWSYFPGPLYRRWLGWKAMEEDGGSEGGLEWEGVHGGRMCFPAMLLHPVKRVVKEETPDSPRLPGF